MSRLTKHFRVTALRHGALMHTASYLLLAGACALTSRASTPAAGGPAELRDPTALYHDMGLLATSGALPFVASLRVLAGPTPDSTLLVLAISLASESLAFRRTDTTYVANYRVSVEFGADPRLTLKSDETVRIGSYEETRRAGESILFQRFLAVPSGTYDVRVRVRDLRNDTEGVSEGIVTVPPVGVTPGLAAPVPVYRGTARDSFSETPRLVVNPRGSGAYGVDTLRLYLEGYQLPVGSVARVWATDPQGRIVWRDSLTVERARVLSGWVIDVPPHVLPVGRIDVRAQWLDRPPSDRLALLMSLSERWITLTFEEMLSLLRYYEHPAAVDSLERTPADQRADEWSRFLQATDPNTDTPAHEGLDAYFRRLVDANRRFSERAAGLVERTWRGIHHARPAGRGRRDTRGVCFREAAGNQVGLSRPASAASLPG
jgi:GWxTD domain-containing protein